MTRIMHSVEQKLEGLRMLSSNRHTVQKVCMTHRVYKSTLERWKARLNSGGVASFEESPSSKIYTKELKQVAVRNYLEHGFTALEVLSKHQISSTSVLYGWMKKYDVYGIKGLEDRRERTKQEELISRFGCKNDMSPFTN